MAPVRRKQVLPPIPKIKKETAADLYQPPKSAIQKKTPAATVEKYRGPMIANSYIRGRNPEESMVRLEAWKFMSTVYMKKDPVLKGIDRFTTTSKLEQEIVRAKRVNVDVSGCRKRKNFTPRRLVDRNIDIMCCGFGQCKLYELDGFYKEGGRCLAEEPYPGKSLKLRMRF